MRVILFFQITEYFFQEGEMKFKSTLIILFLFIVAGCGPGSDSSDRTSGMAADTLDTVPATFTVTLPCVSGGWLDDIFVDDCQEETIEIPNGRPIYALLVSGFHQNKQLDMFHFYDFAKCLLERGAYVHYAWWNNLLAPYMERPLHDPFSIPSTGAIPYGDLLNITPVPPSREKARPRDDVQFQADARRLLIEIRRNNPDAAIILVGHSFGGNAVIRLADSFDDPAIMPPDVPVLDIDLLAPIDPVGNRTCIRSYPAGHWLQLLPFCQGFGNFTRWRATHQDWLFDPPARTYGQNIKYLYHRWQQEGTPPFLDNKSAFYLIYPEENPEDPVDSIGSGSTNVQSVVPTDPDSHPSGGDLDGHGEIVGFRGVDLNPFGGGFIESYPLGLKAQGAWPYRTAPIITSAGNVGDTVSYYPPYDGWPDPGLTAWRVSLMKAWESDPAYFDSAGYAPEHPEYCMVSGDLCEILRTAVNAAPVADAGPDQTLECVGPSGAQVTLDGSGSTDVNDDPLVLTWTGPFGILTGEVVTVEFPLGIHTITLTVDDGRGQTNNDTVKITVMDSAPPAVDLSLSPDLLWPPNHKLVKVTALLEVTDTCDENPVVELVSITSNQSDNGQGDGNTSNDIQEASYGEDDRAFLLRAERGGTMNDRIYTVIYQGADGSGNAASVSAEVTVPHSR
jgi:hypothetical protein